MDNKEIATLKVLTNPKLESKVKVDDWVFNKIIISNHPHKREAWLYIVGRSDDSTSGPGPIYIIWAHIY